MMRYLYVFLIACLVSSCANIVVPEGGEKDLNPPVLVSSSIKNGSVNVKPGKINLYFNEFLQLKDLATEFSISPDPGELPRVTVVKKHLEIKLPSNRLKENTTYTLNFGSSICDLNEGNSLRNFTFRFSTGNSLDSAYLKGVAMDARTRQVLKGALVVFLSKDSLLRYSGKTDDSGKWILNNIAKGSYHLRITADANSNKRTDQGELYFYRSCQIADSNAFLVSKLIPYSRPVMGRTMVTKAKYINENLLYVKLNNNDYPADKIKYSLSGSNQKRTTPPYTTTQADSFLIYHDYIDSDTIILKIETDTLQSFSIKQPKTRRKSQLQIQAVQPMVRKSDPFVFKVNLPISGINSEKILMNGKPLTSDVVHIDPNKFSISGSDFGKARFIFYNGSLTDINGAVNNGDTIDIIVAEPEQTGNLEFKIIGDTTIKKGDLTLRVFNDVNEYFFKSALFQSVEIKGLLPGNYNLEAWFDKNNNRKWDPGNYDTGVEPEDCIQKTGCFLIKPNWDQLGVEILMD